MDCQNMPSRNGMEYSESTQEKERPHFELRRHQGEAHVNAHGPEVFCDRHVVCFIELIAGDGEFGPLLKNSDEVEEKRAENHRHEDDNVINSS